jgi:hypothetical protein
MSPICLLHVAIQRTTTITTFFAVRSTIPRKLATKNSRTRLQAPVHSTGTCAMVLTCDPELRPVTLTRAALPVMTSALGAVDVSRPEEKKKKSFYFPLYAFYFICNIQKKKKSNFEFENSKNQKKKKKREKTGIDH